MMLAKGKTINYENPRQYRTSKYSQKYGKYSPRFARATELETNPSCLFISGTASIVKENTIHQYVLEQLSEATANVNALLSVTEFKVTRENRISNKVTVYIPKKCDKSDIERILKRNLKFKSQMNIVQADLCRPDLLVEIELLLIR